MPLKPALLALALLVAAYAAAAAAAGTAATVELPVLAHPLERGATIADEDVVWTEFPAGRAGVGVVVEADRLIGQEARRHLRAGEPLRATDIKAPVLVRKGSLVTLAYATPAMRLTLVGRALGNGGMGEVVRVLNLQSSRTVEAVIDGKDSAAVRALDLVAAR